MTNEEDPNLELYGTSPRVIVFFMIIISLIVSIGVLPMNAFFFLIRNGDVHPSDYMDILSFVYMPAFIVPLTILNVAYIWKIFRYYKGDCTRYSAIWVGMLSVILPTIYVVVVGGFFSSVEGLLGISSIYLPFIAGLIFMYKISGPEMTSPWRGDLGENHWWTPKRPQWWYRMFPPKGEENTEETEDESPP